MIIQVKKLHHLAQMPVRAHADDAGADVYACTKEKVGYAAWRYGTGLAFATPPGVWIDARPRSSVWQAGMILSNGCGVIDPSYRGEVTAVFIGFDFVAPHYVAGDRILQLIIPGIDPREVEFIEVDELPPPETDRGNGGYGSTGR